MHAGSYFVKNSDMSAHVIHSRGLLRLAGKARDCAIAPPPPPKKKSGAIKKKRFILCSHLDCKRLQFIKLSCMQYHVFSVEYFLKCPPWGPGGLR